MDEGRRTRRRASRGAAVPEPLLDPGPDAGAAGPPEREPEPERPTQPATVPSVTGPGGVTHLLVDGENIDATLGNSVLGGRRPNPEERPRWDRVRGWLVEQWDQPVNGLFFLNASGGNLPLTFVQALLALDYRPIPLAGGPGEKVVDIAIQRTLEALADRPGDIVLASHDRDFLPQLTPLVADRRVALLGFREFISSGYAELREQGLQVWDLEDDTRAFTTVLPRVRIIPLADFDPLRYL